MGSPVSLPDAEDPLIRAEVGASYEGDAVVRVFGHSSIIGFRNIAAKYPLLAAIGKLPLLVSCCLFSKLRTVL